MVHRALFPPAEQRPGPRSLKQVAGHLSDTERNSADAERDSKDVKLVCLPGGRVSRRCENPAALRRLVTDVRNFGFFVDVSGLGMSGLVPLSTLVDDFFQFDSNRGQLIGRKTRRVIKLGDGGHGPSGQGGSF